MNPDAFAAIVVGIIAAVLIVLILVIGTVQHFRTEHRMHKAAHNRRSDAELVPLYPPRDNGQAQTHYTQKEHP